MKETNSTEQLFDGIFRDTLGNAPSAVPPGAWEGISASLGHAAAAGSAAAAGTAVKSALWVKALLAVCVAGAAAAGWWFAAEQHQEAHKVPVSNQMPETSSAPENTVIPAAPEKQEPESLQKPLAGSGNGPKTAAKSAEPQKTGSDNLFRSYNTPDVTYGKTGTFGFRMPEQPVAETRTPATEQHQSDNKPEPDKADGHERQAESDHEPEAAAAAPATADSSFILVPDVFTADGDGINDTYQIVLIGEERYEMVIYSLKDNRILFRSKNKYQAWNGKMPDGEDAPSGTYMVKLVYKFKNKTQETKWVKLTLIR